MLKTYLKKIRLFGFRERITILVFSLCEILSDRLDKNIIQTHLVFSELLRKEIPVEKQGKFNSVTSRINNKNIRVLLKRNSSDALVFQQLILEDEYSDVLEIFQCAKLAPKTMIDAGANIGLATLYFKAYYPELNIVALEPTGETYLRLKQNCEINELKNVRPLEQGLWKKDTLLHLDKSFRDGKDWSFRLVEDQNSDSNSIKARSVASLMDENGWESLDFLKIDIEGGEVVVFENQDAVKDWLPRVKVLSIEIHDEFNCRENIYALLKENNFVLQESKSIVIATNSALV